MTAYVIIIGSVVLGLLILYLANIKFEFRYRKEEPANLSGTKASLASLSNAELRILRLVAGGKSNQEIADEMCISVHTVKKHIANIFKKLGLKSRTEARKYQELL